MLLRPSGGGTGSRVSEIERRREKAKRESPYAEWHVEPVVAAESEAWKCGTRFRLCTLTCRARRYFFARVLLLSATPTVQRNHFFFADCRFAHRTDLAVRSCFQPLVKARPAASFSGHITSTRGFVGTYQNKWPHILTTASLAVSRQMLHSNIRSSFFSSSVAPEPSPSGCSVECFAVSVAFEGILTGFCTISVNFRPSRKLEMSNVCQHATVLTWCINYLSRNLQHMSVLVCSNR